MKIFTHQVRNGEWKGYTGKSIRNIVNIELEEVILARPMVCKALQF